MIDRNHPAVRAGVPEGAKVMGKSVAATGAIDMPGVTLACILAALPQLTAADLPDRLVRDIQARTIRDAAHAALR